MEDTGNRGGIIAEGPVPKASDRRNQLFARRLFFKHPGQLFQRADREAPRAEEVIEIRKGNLAVTPTDPERAQLLALDPCDDGLRAYFADLGYLAGGYESFLRHRWQLRVVVCPLPELNPGAMSAIKLTTRIKPLKILERFGSYSSYTPRCRSRSELSFSSGP